MAGNETVVTKGGVPYPASSSVQVCRIKFFLLIEDHLSH